MSGVSRLKQAFQQVEGGLFSAVNKADVGDGAMRMMEQGVTLLCWADPFFPDASTPDHIRQAALQAVEQGSELHYTMPIGSATLRDKIARRMRKRGFEVDGGRNVLITPGSDAGLFYAMFPFVEPGDEILVADPSYPNNFQNAALMGGKLVRVPLDASRGYALDAAAFESRITSRSKLVVLTNPNNPTTTVFHREELEDLCRLIVKHDLVLVVDQAFEDVIFDGREMVDAALLPGMWERTLTVCSTSKGMGLSGYRVGYIVACDQLMDKLYGAAVTVVGAANTMAQIAAEKGFDDDGFVQDYQAVFDRRRTYLYDKFSSIPGVRLELPQSSFLAWVDISALGTGAELVDYLAREAKCLVNDGANYGRQGEGHLRIVFGCLRDDRALFDAVDRMAAALRKLEGKPLNHRKEG